jgi:hypothetical protein
MMMIHRMMLKTHLLLTTHVRSVHSILFRSSLQTTKPTGVPNPCPNVRKSARGAWRRRGYVRCRNPCTFATSRHSPTDRARPLKQSGGLEVPSSNLGAPIEKGPAERAFSIPPW